MHDYLVVTYGIVLYFVIAAIYTLVFVPIIQGKMINKMFDDDEDEISIADLVEQARTTETS